MKNTLKGFTAMLAAVVIVAVTAITLTSADESADSDGWLRGRFNFGRHGESRQEMQDLTDEEKEAKRAEMEAHKQEMENMTDEEKEVKRAEMEAQMAEHQAQMAEVMASGDYAAWKELISESPRGDEMAEEVTEDEFPRLVEAWNLMQEAREKMDDAREIYEEIGITGPGFGMGMGMGEPGHGKGMGRGPGRGFAGDSQPSSE